MDIKKDKYIILEIIPTNLKEKDGVIIQLSALKLEGLNLIDRFDYRIEYDKLPIPEMKSWIDYDIDSFNYVKNEEEILKQFKIFSEDNPILLLDNIYTPSYFKDYKQHQILDLLNLEYNEKIIEDIISKYNLQPSEYIVDLLYEALMMEYK